MQITERILGAAENGSDDWRRLRQKGIGGSDVAKLFKLSQYSGPIGVYVSKVSPIEIQQKKDDRLEQLRYFGHMLEPVIMNVFKRDNPGLDIVTTDNMYYAREHDFILGNPDGLIIEGAEIVSGVEIKNMSIYRREDFKAGIPDEYMLQIQHYMYVLDVDTWYIAWLLGGNEFCFRKIGRDQELIEIIVEKITDFWYNNVLKRVIPLPSFSDSDALKTLDFPPREKKILDDNLVNGYVELNTRILKMQREREEIKNTIKLKMEGAELGETTTYYVKNKTKFTVSKVKKKEMK